MEDIMFVIFVMALSFTLGVFVGERGPSAMDVYRGKTSLKVVYENGKADSTVIWKSEVLDSLVYK